MIEEEAFLLDRDDESVDEDTDVVEGDSITVDRDDLGGIYVVIYHGCCREHATRIRLHPSGAEVLAAELDFEAGVALALIAGVGVSQEGVA